MARIVAAPWLPAPPSKVSATTFDDVGSRVTTPSRRAGGRPVDGAVVPLGLVCEVVRGGVVRGAVVGRVLVAVRGGVVPVG
ncbi:hypothetical protein GCM10025782_22010 [Pedococcus ginsenosidimutans]|uniref:Uncharacterized protein n=1 Tax=Pedococcus ginsenosidimutans TaxID=490570 RepID=A0ABP8YA16_9MICO